MRRMAVAALVALAAVSGACSEDLDRVAWACSKDADCGSGARCERGLCVLGGPSSRSGGLSCETPPGAAALPGSFRLEADGAGARALVFSAGARALRVPLPPDVLGLDGGPLEGCCEAPCCRE